MPTVGNELLVKGVAKRFGGLTVLKGVDLNCGPGEVVGLIGPNGAGKSTLINAITSFMPVDTGEVRIGDVRVSNTTPQFCSAAGLARTFQNIKLFANLTVRQNIEVALTSGRRDRPAQASKVHVEELLDWFGLARSSTWKAGALSYGNQRRLEIARALALGPSYLLLDEPAAGMNGGETSDLIASVNSIRDRFGCGLVIIDHDLRFIMTACKRIYVLDAGAIVASGSPEEVRSNPKVIEVYIGHDRTQRHQQAGRQS
ncbi:ABC transporter ATP-binding protein [Mesorhizobium sp. CO1-1-8]|uniref:ABC transporter ATP-binding protein n=1 Tax=Mesorhizobium sp. CO1-1-8 TaxID=2876631 RepID=UPI001CD0B0F2|nr:ABC transporter ATP-binding protein [Mesorhizobium sp. CO1-1-8]MBZ9772472.1 ABC transporter ATP-binding protein [Mesorhizobium sp. CO1-1-8]